jgi:acyl-coenzyme A synthetase/AMP-(fatty) acid ligase
MFDTYIAFWAKLKPQSLAIWNPDAGVTYAQFDRDINQFAAALEALDLPATGLVGVRLQNPYAHWLALMALSRLRCTSVSIPLRDAPGRQVLAVARPELLLADDADPPLPAELWGRVAALSPDWLAATLRSAAPPIPERACDPDAIGRVSLSSGTTGVPKAVPFTWRRIIERAQHRAVIDRGRDDVALILAGNDTNFGFGQRVATWVAGATVAMGPEVRQMPSAFPAMRPTVLILAAGYLRMLLQALPRNFQPIPTLRVRVGGGAMSPLLARQARLRLASDVQITYSSTEGGSIARGPATLLEAHPGAVGYKLPWTQVEAVDPGGQRCPPGVAGELRVRGTEMVAGYHTDHQQTAKSFRDGWFYSGDVGTIMADGEIRILGRVDEVMNFGGVKILPGAVENVLRGSPGVAEVAVFSVVTPAGVAALWAAVVRTDLFDQTELSGRLRQALPPLPALHIAFTDAIPCTDNGKVDVPQLRALAATVPSRL